MIQFELFYLFSATCNNVKSDESDPYFLKTETNVTVHEGDLARLKCRVANLGTKMVNVVGYILYCVFRSFCQFVQEL